MYWKNMAGKWKVVSIVLALIVLAVGIICLIAGIKSGQEGISFIDALGQMFGAAGEVVEEVVTDPEAGEVVEDAVETASALLA